MADPLAEREGNFARLALLLLRDEASTDPEDLTANSPEALMHTEAAGRRNSNGVL
jgi:hypothetical protein